MPRCPRRSVRGRGQSAERRCRVYRCVPAPAHVFMCCFWRALARLKGMLKHATVPAQERVWHTAVGGEPLPLTEVRARTRTCTHVLFLACASTL